MTISMLGLAGIPATAGFIGKFYLIDAAVSGGYTWLGVVIVVGSMISLGYYLPVIAAMWMREAPAGAGQPGAAPSPARAPGARRSRTAGAGRRIPELDAEPRAGAAHSDPRTAARGRLRRGPRRRGDALLRDHPPAAVRPRARHAGGALGGLF